MIKNLVLAVNLGDAPDWQIKAMTKQMGDWVEVNKELLPFENLIILPTTGDTRLYWLEGVVGSMGDLEALESIKDRLEPILNVALDLKIDREKKYRDPYAKLRRIKQINERVQLKKTRFSKDN
jgi:hypothetical protein